MEIKLRHHASLCMMEGCLGEQDYQLIMVARPWAVPDCPPVIMDFPIKVCRLHRSPELNSIVMSLQNWVTLCEVFAEKGLGEPKPEMTTVQYRQIEKKEEPSTLLTGPEMKRKGE